MTIAESAAGYCAILTAVQLVSTGVARFRCPARKTPLAPPVDAPPITIVRPVCGVENFAAETLGSSFTLHYPHYEVLFCAARADDAALPLVRRLMAEHPDVPSRILIGDDWVNANPKLNNIVKGWDAAQNDWLVMADSNVLMPPDYLQRCLDAWTPGTGLICSTPIGSHPDGFWAELECGFLNTLQARWQYAAEAIGLGFAQGKTMLWSRRMLEKEGGIRALGAEIAEDAAATKLVRRKGLRVRLVDSPFQQPLGRRTLSEVWARQLRWARLRRVTFPLFFLPEFLTGSLFSIMAAAWAGPSFGVDAWLAGLVVGLIWFLAEAQLAVAAGWRFTWRSIFAYALRDIMLPALFVSAWLASDFVWRGNVMDVRESKQAQ